MTNDEKVTKDLKLTLDHGRAIIDNPALLDDVVNGSYIVYLEDGEPKPKRKVMPTGEPITYIRVNKNWEVIKK